MPTPKRLILALQKSVLAWADFFKVSPIDSPTVNGDISLPFAAQRLLASIGELDEVLACQQSLWPSSVAWCEAISRQTRLEHLFPDHQEWADGNDVSTALFLLALQEPADDESNTSDPDIELVLAAIWRYRQRTLTFSATPAGRFAYRVGSDLGMIRAMTASIQGRDRRVLAEIVKTYLSHSWLFPWIGLPETQSVKQRYEPLYELTTGDRMMEQSSLDILHRILNIGEVADDRTQQVRRILERVESAIGQVGYDDFCDSITADGGQYGPDSMIGSGGPINVIPSDGPGACCDLALAVSKGSAGSRFGFNKIARQVREHLIRCFGKTKVVIFLTDSWSRTNLAESRGDFEAHRERGHVVIPILVNGRQLVPMIWE